MVVGSCGRLESVHLAKVCCMRGGLVEEECQYREK